MPTYVFTTARALTEAEQERLVASVTAIHQVEATAPRYFVQVIFHKVEAGAIYIGGQKAPADHVWVRADIRSGRTREQKAKILTRIMRETGEILGVSEESVWVYISDIPAEAVAEFGAILPQPGEEERWLQSLPADLKQKLRAY